MQRTIQVVVGVGEADGAPAREEHVLVRSGDVLVVGRVLHLLDFDLDADIRELLLDDGRLIDVVLVFADGDLIRLAQVRTGLLEKLLGFLGVVIIGRRAIEVLRVRGHGARRVLGGAAEHGVDDPVGINRVVDGLPEGLVVERRLLAVEVQR